MGALYRILSHFLFNGLNMLQLESRPIEGKIGNIDFLWISKEI